MDSEKDIREVVLKYSDMLYRICIVMLCNEQDAQDAIQDTFCRYLEKKPEFHDREHEKAWLIRVATNICRDMIRFRLRHPKVCIDDLENSLAAPEHRETLRELLELPAEEGRSFGARIYDDGYVAEFHALTQEEIDTMLGLVKNARPYFSAEEDQVIQNHCRRSARLLQRAEESGECGKDHTKSCTVVCE